MIAERVANGRMKPYDTLEELAGDNGINVENLLASVERFNGMVEKGVGEDLPPYSPDLNPIEMMWSKMKAILRKWKIRNANDLRTAIHRALSLVSESDVLHWFSFSGYCC